MIFQTVKNLLLSKDLFAQLQTFSIMKHEGSLIFYHAAIGTGLFDVLRKPSGISEIAEKLNIADKQLLSSLLDLGCSLKELSCKKGHYRLRGTMAKALMGNIPMRELIRETVQYHSDVARSLHMYLLENRKGNYLKDFGGVIAESSRILEPMIKAFIYHTVKKTTPLTILEFGCGAGEYLKYYVDINKNNKGTAIDIDASAVEIAQKKIKENRIEENFIVIQGNILETEVLKDKSFDLATSFSNMHYFSMQDKIKLFSSIHKLLTNNGRFILATGFKNTTLSSSYYDLIFSATERLYPLPYIEDIINDLKSCGFKKVKTVNLLGDSVMGVVAFK
jgi:ubiquinone/menaquinone biosynthesis C-methylase UbiE